MAIMSRKWLLLGVIVIIIIAIAIFLLIDLDNDGLPTYQEWFSLGTNPFLVDSDGDKLLDGDSIILNDSNELYEILEQEGIPFRLQSDGTCQFYGEQYFGSAPSIYSLDEANQAKFLSMISEGEYEQLEQEGILLNNNLDGDLWSNYFERTITETPIDVKNEVYVILMTMAGREYAPVDQIHRFLEEIVQFPSENRYELSLENNNKASLEAAINDVALKADENDLVLVYVGGHGGVGSFRFYTGEATTYDWMNEQFNKIDSKALVIFVDSCHSGSAIEPLTNNEKQRIILTSCGSDEEAGFGIIHEFFNGIIDIEADLDENGYVSVGEAVNYSKKRHSGKYITPQLSDINDVGKNLHLFEINPRAFHEYSKPLNQILGDPRLK